MIGWLCFLAVCCIGGLLMEQLEILSKRTHDKADTTENVRD